MPVKLLLYGSFENSNCVFHGQRCHVSKNFAWIDISRSWRHSSHFVNKIWSLDTWAWRSTATTDGHTIREIYSFGESRIPFSHSQGHSGPRLGGRFQYLAVKSSNGFAKRGMKYTSQHCCDIIMDDKMALYRECCFLNCKNHGE